MGEAKVGNRSDLLPEPDGAVLSLDVANLQRQGRGPKQVQGNNMDSLSHPSKSSLRAPHKAANEPPFQGFGHIGLITRGVAPG